MEEPPWWSYFKRIAGTETGRVIAEAAGVSEPQVSRWKSGKNRPDADALARFARHYKRPPVEAIVAAGYLRRDEVLEAVEVIRPLSELGDEELLDEIRRRMSGGSNAVEATTQSDAPGEADEDQKTVVELPRAARRGGSSEGRARRRKQDEDDQDLAARDTGGISEGERTRRDMDQQGEAPDPEGPEDGA